MKKDEKNIVDQNDAVETPSISKAEQKKMIADAKRLKRKHERKKNLSLSVFAIPGFIWFMVFSYLPLFGLILAFKNFKNYDGNFVSSLFKSEWTLNNFKFFFKSSKALEVTRNTLGYNAIFIVLNIVVPLLVAIMLNELLNKRSGKVYQTMMFLPYFLSWIVISYSAYALLQVDKGLINGLLAKIGIKGPNWYKTPQAWPFIFVFLNTWKGVGYNSVIYLASLAGIDKSYYEAASIDGASKFQQMRFITIPLLKPVIIILFILSLGGIFRSDFGMFFHVPNAGGNPVLLSKVTEVIDTYVYKLLIQTQNLKQSAAISFMQSVIGFILVFASNRLVRRWDPERALY